MKKILLCITFCLNFANFVIVEAWTGRVSVRDDERLIDMFFYYYKSRF